MESLDELSRVGGKPNFMKHVFNFNEESKAEILNIVQYAVLALVPVVILNKTMQKYVPEADEDKASGQVVLEILAQVIVMFLGILLIHRVITFIPTYSGDKYADFSITNVILAMLVIILSLQTKLGEKVSILSERLMELWEGPKQKKKGNVKVSQPISQNQMSQNQMAQTQSLNSAGSTSISSLPTDGSTQQFPDYNSMYQQDPTPLVGAASPSMESFGPMAANDAIGSSFGSAFGGW
jgi:hypothetical protein